MATLKAENLFSVKDLVFVITGGGSGLGSMMARTLDANGASKVYILGRRKDKLDEVAKQAINGSIIPLVADITSKDSLSAAATHIESETGYVNTVIANSGVMGPTLPFPKDRTPTIAEVQELLWNQDHSAFTETMNVNTTGVFYTLIAFLSLLDAGNNSPKSPTSGGGKSKIVSQFIATTSIAGFSRTVAAGFAYSASKAAANHLLKIMATFLIPYHIRVNIIAPGPYRTEMLPDVGIEDGTVPASLIPLTRGGSDEDMAGAILSLCGRGGAYLNGTVVITDGGRLGGQPASY